MAFQMVFFAYQAIEFVGITTSETANPRQVLPKAIKEIPIRIVIFYVGALLAIMAIFPWQQLPVNKSPFVTVFQMVGIKWAAGLINFVVLTAAASSLNSTLYSTGRHLYQIAKETPNSKVMNRLKLNSLSRMGIPSRAIIFFCDCGCCFSLYQCLARCLRCLCLDYSIFFWCLHCYLHFDYACPS